MFRYITSLALLLAGIWLLFSGHWTHPVLVPLGAGSVLFSVWLSYRLGILDRTTPPIRLILLSLRYWPWLLGQIVLANLHVARTVLAREIVIQPQIRRSPSSQTTDLGRAMLANSITLTPGTVAIHVRSNEIWFYALDDHSAEDTLSGEMDRRVRAFEESTR